MSSLRDEAAAARELLDALRGIRQLDDESEDLAVEGETSLVEAVGAAYEVIAEALAFIEALEIRKGKIETRIAVLEARAGRVRDEIATAIDIAGVKHVRLPEGTIYPAQTPPKVEVMQESLIPERFWKTETVRKLDKVALAKALKSNEFKGQDIGAVLGNGRRTIAMRKN
jgi:hypothetical protein